MLAARIRDRLSRVQFAGDTIGATIGWAVYPDAARPPPSCWPAPTSS